jgi:hypothetical protein
MKAIRTIVATAVIVFALTTAAMAGVQRFGNSGDADRAGSAAQPAATPDTAPPAGAVTLSARQFATLLHAVAGDGARDRTRTAQPKRSVARAHKQDTARSHTGSHAATRASRGTRGGSTPSSAGGETHHSTTQHTTTRTHTQTHDGGTRDSGSHDGGCY